MVASTVVAALVAAAALVVTPACAGDSIVLYRDYHFRGPKIEVGTGEPSFPSAYNDWASSAVVKGGTWILYTDFDYQGTVSILKPGRYSSPAAMGIPNDKLSSMRPFPPPSTTSILLFKDNGFKGTMLHLTGSTSDLRFLNFNDHASSLIVLSGAWRLYQHVNYNGNYVDYSPGQYPHVDTNDDLSSCKPVAAVSDGADEAEEESDESVLSEVTAELERFRHQVEE